MKYIFVSGGVVSGLGKGVISASLGLILKSAGLIVTNVKVDMYLNLDAGTIRPQEHGEVFVTTDGLETDQDLGNYERFTNSTLKRENYLTTGQVYKSVIDRERAFGYKGEDVEAIPHVTDEIINRLYQAGKKNKSEIVIVELGGTVGEYQNILFFEANRILKLRYPRNVLHLHVSYLPVIKSLGELKSKPAQQSVRTLQGMGIQPDFLITRSEKAIDEKRKEKLALFCNLKMSEVISCPDADSIYSVPELLNSQDITQKIARKLHLPRKNLFTPDLATWQKANTPPKSKSFLKIALVGKYFQTGNYVLKDSYVSVIEALRQASNTANLPIKFLWLNSETLSKNLEELKDIDGLIVPQGWGSRGVEGKIKAIKFVRENKIPFLGLCFGMQVATIEFARHVCLLKKANSAEVDPTTPHPVVHIMPEQKEFLDKHQYGGTIRLGSYPCVLKKDSLLSMLYRKYGSDKNAPWHSDQVIKSNPKKDHDIVTERHRHRYEFNNEYRTHLEDKGLSIVGTSPDGKLVEAVEIPSHPFFLATQFHPEYIARPLSPHPLFLGFLHACKAKKSTK